jgi:hypothetical protein
LQTLTEHWNGSQWVAVPSPNASQATASTLVAVAAVSSSNVWAVGNYQVAGQYQWETLIEHWNGTRWSIVPSPSSSHGQKSFLNAVAAISANNIWAVGYSENTQLAPYDLPLIEHYNGVSWTMVSAPYPAPSQYSSLYSLAVVSANDIWAAGYTNENTLGQNGTALIEHWNGTKWNLISNPVAGSATTLYGLASTSSSNVWAVGYVSNGTSLDEPLTEHWNGTSWSIVFPPHPGQTGLLFGLSTAGGTFWAAGAYSASPLVSGFLQAPKTLVVKK